MDAVTVHAGPLEFLRQPLAHVLGVAENHHPLITLAAHQPQNSLRFFQRRTAETELVNIRPVLLLRFHGDFHLIPLIHPGNRHNLLGNGSGKQAQILPVLYLFNNPGHILEKAHIQHPVGFVQYHGLNFVQADGLAVIMVHQPPGGCHYNLGLALQLLDLSADSGAAVEHRHPDSLVIGQQAPQFVADLDGQLPGRCQNQSLNPFYLRVNVLNHGNAKGKGFARSRGCLGNHIPPLHEVGNRFGLNGGGIAVPLLLQSLQHCLGQAKAFKCNIHVSASFFRIFWVIVPSFL